MDDDLQNPPEELPRLLKGFESGADVVYGSPLMRRIVWLGGFPRVTRWVLKEVMGAEGAQMSARTGRLDARFEMALPGQAARRSISMSF